MFRPLNCSSSQRDPSPNKCIDNDNDNNNNNMFNNKSKYYNKCNHNATGRTCGEAPQ